MLLSTAGRIVLLGFLAAMPQTIAEAGEPSREVLVYYANETAPDAAESANYATFIKWLQSSDHPKAQAAAKALEDDTRLFPQAVDDEISGFRSRAVNGTLSMPVMIFTNRLARAGQCLVYDPQIGSGFRTEAFPVTADSNFIVASNPLSQGQMLSEAMKTTARLFDPQRHEFVLITKSHGGPDLALTLKLARRANGVTREQVLKHLAAGTSDLPVAKIGTTKDDYLAILRRAGDELGMKFPLVFLESCLGSFSPAQMRAVPPNVGTLYSSGQRFLEFRTLNYFELFEHMGKSRTLSVAMGEFLQPRYLSISPYRAGGWQILTWLWFVPLIGWFWWVCKVQLRDRGGRRVVKVTALESKGEAI